MTLPISTWLDQGIGLDVFCQCGRTGYLSVEQARAAIPAAQTLIQGAFRLRCAGCGAKGPPMVSLRFAIKDYYALERARRNAGG